MIDSIIITTVVLLGPIILSQQHKRNQLKKKEQMSTPYIKQDIMFLLTKEDFRKLEKQMEIRESLLTQIDEVDYNISEILYERDSAQDIDYTKIGNLLRKHRGVLPTHNTDTTIDPVSAHPDDTPRDSGAV